MTNSQRVQRIIDEYNRQLIGVERMLARLHAAEFMLEMEHIKVASGCRSQKSMKKTATIWGCVNLGPFILGLITLNPFSIGLSGGMVIFETVLGVRAHIKGKKLAKMEQKIQTSLNRTRAYINHLESQAEYFSEKIDELEEVLEKARAKGQEPSDQVILDAMQGKSAMLLEAGGTEQYMTPELNDKLSELSSRVDFIEDDDSCGIEIE